MRKITLLSFIVFLSLGVKSQDYGLFGKKNLVGVHASWFFRSIPQYFYAEKMYRFNEQSNELVSNSLRNHIWHAGFSYRRVVSKKHAFGFQAEYYTRAFGNPIHTKDKKINFKSVWTGDGNLSNNIWSNELQNTVSMIGMKMTKSSAQVVDLKLIWSRTKTMSVLPIGLVSTLGLGFQNISMNTANPIHINSLQMDTTIMNWSNERATYKLNNAPAGFANDYFGIGWLWDLSLNYPLTKSLIFTVSSDIRGTAFVFWKANDAQRLQEFPTQIDGTPTLEGIIHGRNMSKEIRKEMLFQNTFRVGLTFAF